MAAGEPKFSHITVTPDDEDDVVIEAGARPSRSATPAAPRAEEPVAAPVEAPKAPAAPEAPARAEADDAPKKRAKDADYQETTIDDLKAAPMPLAQKIVLALAAVGVIAIAVYFFMR